jgi:hypothetical protein
MQLNPTLTALLEAYELEHLQALVNWLEPEDAHLTVQSTDLSEFSPLPEELPPMNTLSATSILASATAQPVTTLDDLVAFSLLHEFGADFQGKTCFDWLRNCVTRRFNPDASAQ